MQKPKTFKLSRGVQGAKIFNPNSHIDAMYKGEWEDYSKRFLAYNPRCYCCGEHSQATDHIRPHKGDPEIFWKTDNLIPLCHRCHNTITAKFDRVYVKNKEELLHDKLKWIKGCRFFNDLTFSIKVVPRKK